MYGRAKEEPAMTLERGDDSTEPTFMPGSRAIRVDKDVYRLLQAKKHELEKELGRSVPMTDAVKAVLDANPDQAPIAER
jgi:hypothetical protein